MSAKFKDGWTVECQDPERRFIYINSMPGMMGDVAVLYGAPGERFDDANLLAAAPDLLAALKDTHALLQATLLVINDAEARSIAKQQLDANRAAIAKATGGAA